MAGTIREIKSGAWNQSHPPVRGWQSLLADKDLIRIQLLLHLHRIPPFIFWWRAEPALADAIDHDIREHDEDEQNAHYGKPRCMAPAT